MQLFIFSLLAPTIISAISVPHTEERSCNHDNCLRAMIQSASGFCSTYAPAPKPTSLPSWATACTAKDTTSQMLSSCACLPITTSTSSPMPPKPIPIVWLCGDSTMAPGGGHNGTEGWGQYLKYSFNPSEVYVNNSAYAGRSARSFTREGRFQAIADEINRGDWVVIEFGINDAGTLPPYPTPDAKGRIDCGGVGNETCLTVYNNVTEVVQTFPTYIKNASSIFLAKGAAGIILSSQNPTNVWETGNYSYTPDIFPYYQELSATELGGPSKGVYFVPHGAYVAQAEKNLGPEIVDANYPMDHTHTAPFLADVVAKSFVLGLKCGTSPLQDLVINATSRMEGSVLGTCLPANERVPI